MKIPGYTIENQIGQGGMSMVYRAIQDSLHRPVALKIMNPVFSDSSEYSARFLGEGRLLASLQHPHIVTIYDIGITEDFHYISMEYVDGGDLKQRMHQNIPIGTALDYIIAVSSGLKAAHDADIVHRDVKPANILFRRDGTVLLTDFGIAKQLATDNGMTATGSLLGSPYYLSPEQALGWSVDGRADIYSLGVVLYEMLVSEKPFNGNSQIDIAMKHVEADLPRLPEGLSHYQALLENMMAKAPGDRFRDADSLMKAARQLRYDGHWHGDTEATASIRTTTEAPDYSRDHASSVGEKAQVLTAETKDHVIGIETQQPLGTLIDNRRLALKVHSFASRKIVGLVGVLMLLGILAARGLNNPDEQGVLAKASNDAPSKPPTEISHVEADEKERQAKLAKQAEVERQAELETQAALTRQNELERQAKLTRQTKLDRQTELARQIEFEKQSDIDNLLMWAQSALENYKLTTPANDSAYYYYQKVLERDPGNALAIAGFSHIAERYLSLGRKAFNQGRINSAKRYVELGLQLNHSQADLLALNDQLVHDKGHADQVTHIRGVGKSARQLFRRVKGIFDRP